VFTIRRVFDNVIPINRSAVGQVQQILRSQFVGVREEEIETIGDKLRNPFLQRFNSILLVAETRGSRVLGFAMVLHDPDLRFCYLDFIASDRKLTSRGTGGAIYERVRDEARGLGAMGVFFECLPDEPSQCPDPELLRENRARLRFYEQYGARPIDGTDYQRPVNPGDECMPLLVFDGLGSEEPPRRAHVRKVVRAVLERKYSHLCPPEYVEAVVGSVKDDPVRLRGVRYLKKTPEGFGAVRPVSRRKIALIVNDRHDIHHVQERGYVEAPVRIGRILTSLKGLDAFERFNPRRYPMAQIKTVHDPAFIDYLSRVCMSIGNRKSIYPYVFPIRNRARPPRDLSVRAGYYCMDTFTPLNANAWLAARRGVDCAVSAAWRILDGWRMAYALVRPPGHHAERGFFGGFCYLNNCAVAAQVLSAFGRVAILDLDYHHGNGQQDIFYDRSDVLTVSIHGHPDFAYPYFSGFAEERGAGPGEGYCHNLPLKEHVDGELYLKALSRAAGVVHDYAPDFLVVALGLDTAKLDPTGSWSLMTRDFRSNGALVGKLRLPTLVVQEGGYRTRTLGANAAAFFAGLLEGASRLPSAGGSQPDVGLTSRSGTAARRRRGARR
jgi:acetoin utilization deacetylase AcuC-like enzyme/GNAT superfamily N-acetyltransferase